MKVPMIPWGKRVVVGEFEMYQKGLLVDLGCFDDYRSGDLHPEFITTFLFQQLHSRPSRIARVREPKEKIR